MAPAWSRSLHKDVTGRGRLNHIRSTRVLDAPAADDARLAAVRARDAAMDGRFWYAVATTGVYCRPSCPARPAKAENISFHDSPAAARAAGFRPCRRCRPDMAARLDQRLTALDGDALAAALDADGFARTGPLLTAAECAGLRAVWSEGGRFRSHVDMARHGFGQGAYRYFANPLPDAVATLRAGLYPALAGVANRWRAALGEEEAFPDTLDAWLRHCHGRGQTKPTPLLLRYGPGDWNALHQDVYGEAVFPLQLAVMLSDPKRDFTGGEFVLSEQRPRRQSRPSVVSLAHGEGVVFAVRERPCQGTRGVYRAVMRHGVSRVETGERFVLGVIFHDAG